MMCIRSRSVFSLLICISFSLFLLVSQAPASSSSQEQSGQKPAEASEEQGQSSEPAQQEKSQAQTEEQEQGQYKIILKQRGIKIDTQKVVPRDIQIKFEQAQVAQQEGEPAVNFAFDSAELSTYAKGLLKEVARDLLKKASYEVVIEGHTDSIGSADYNKELGLRRALSVKTFFSDEGQLDKSKVQAVSYGEEKPIASNDTPDGRADNRRVEISVKYSGTQQQK